MIWLSFIWDSSNVPLSRRLSSQNFAALSVAWYLPNCTSFPIVNANDFRRAINTQAKPNPIPLTCLWSIWTEAQCSVSLRHLYALFRWIYSYFSAFWTFIYVTFNIACISMPPDFKRFCLSAILQCTSPGTWLIHLLSIFS